VTGAASLPSPNVPIRHLAFFRAASAAAEGSAEYRTLLAGLVVLRLLDKWRSHATTDRELKFREVLAVKRTVDAIPDGPIRRILTDLVDTISAFSDGAADSRVVKLIAYAQLLEFEARFEASADVYVSAIDLVSTREQDRELLPLCYQRAGVCARKLGWLDRAAELFRAGLAAATANDDAFWTLKLRLSGAMHEYHKGDLPLAERLLDAIIADADAGGLTLAAAEARHERGLVAYTRNQDGLAVQYYYAAMKVYVDPMMKLRAMHDLATALADMGHLEYARTVLSAIQHSAGENVEMRYHAMLNLMRVAVLSGEQVKFDQLRRELAGKPLPSYHLAHYHVFTGQGYLKFGEPAKAREAFAEALVVAEKHRVYKVLMQADELLRTMPEERAPAWSDTGQPEALLLILDDIRNRRGEFAEATE
jgi:tetratricopeptide (TPR) repeat protein